MSTYRGPINTDPGPGEASIIIYGYVPSLALGVVGAVAFFLVLLANAWYALSQRGYRSFHTLLLARRSGAAKWNERIQLMRYRE
jgi:hypothetical protein